MINPDEVPDRQQPSPRRHFLANSLGMVGGLITATKSAKSATAPGHHSQSAATEAPAGRQSEHESVSYRIFDAHLHCPSDETHNFGLRWPGSWSDTPQVLWQWYPVTQTFAEFVAYLDRTGVQRGIINSPRSQEAKSPADFIAGNREVARYVEKCQGRFLGACVVNPLFVDEALKEIEYCRKQLGFVWVGELHNEIVPYKYTMNEFELLVDQVTKLNMVLAVSAGFEDMHYLIHKFPNTTLVFPNFEGHADDIFARIELVAAHRNAYIETSGLGHDRVGILEYAVNTIGEDRILYGSDFTLNCPATVIGPIQNALLSRQQKQKILAENLEALLTKVGSSI